MAAAPRPKAQTVELNVDVVKSRKTITETHCQLGLAGPHVPGKNEKWRSVQQEVQRPNPLPVLFVAPFLQEIWPEHRFGFLLQPLLRCVESNQAPIPFLGISVGEVDYGFE